MENLIQVLLYFVPALLVLGTCYLLLKKYLDNEQKMKLLSLKRDMQGTTLPLRLQAYERLAVFLERITPNSLLFRVQKPNQTVRELQGDLLNTIRAEFEHNLSQQIYVSPRAWELTKNAKEDIIRIVNIAATQLNPQNPAMELSKNVFEVIIKTESMPTQKALDQIKTEVRQML